jgi:MYXO-CTERM domain-containing protein
VKALKITRTLGIGAALSISIAANAQITQWNFNGDSATTVPGGELSPTPSLGLGFASLVGGVAAASSFGSGTANGGSSDPVNTTPSNYGWQTTTYAAQGAESGLRGVQFHVSTLGFENIAVDWDQRHSNTSSRYLQFQYSIDGVSFTSAGLAGDGIFVGAASDTWFNNRTVDLSSIAGVADNADFAFRIVAIFDPSLGNAYTASNPGSSYASTGTYRFDMVTVDGTAIPTPGAAALLGLAGLTATRRRRR